MPLDIMQWVQGNITVPDGMSLSFNWGGPSQVTLQKGTIAFAIVGMLFQAQGAKIAFRGQAPIDCPQSTPGGNTLVNHEAWVAAQQSQSSTRITNTQWQLIDAFIADFNAMKTALINQGLLKLPA